MPNFVCGLFFFPVSTYFQTFATVIPVLLVAGMINPSLLREYSKSELSAGSLKKDLNHAFTGITVAIAGIVIAPGITSFIESQDSNWWFLLYLLVLLLALYCAYVLATTSFFILKLAKIALDENPHPDRLKSEEQELEWRLASVRRKLLDSGSDSANESSTGAH